MSEYVLTCVLLYSLKGLYKGTYTLPKQHKRRSGIRFTLVYFNSFDMWHCYVGSIICGDTLQHFSISEHVDRCPFINMSAITSPSCMRSGECVSRHRFVCFLILDVFVSPSLASQWGESLYSDQDSGHAIRIKEITFKSVCRTSSLKYVLRMWLSILIQTFVKIYYIFFRVMSNSNPELVVTVCCTQRSQLIISCAFCPKWLSNKSGPHGLEHNLSN